MKSKIKMQYKSVRAAMASSLLLLCACGVTMAQAAIRVDCEAKFLDELNRLTEPDREIFGLKARDWKPEHVDEWQRQSLACINTKPNWGDAMKDSMRQAVTATAARSRTNLFARRDDAMRKQGLAANVTDQKLTQVVLNGSGNPQEINTFNRDNSNRGERLTCNTLKQSIGFAKVESYRQAVAFGRMCQQMGMTDPGSLALLERQAAGIDALYDAIDTFTNQVSAAAKQPASEAKVRELVAARERVAAQIKSLSLPLNDSYYTKAVSSIEKMQDQLNAQACEAQLIKAGFPSAWKAHFILMELNSPDLFANVICAAQRSGAQVRYLSGGLMSKEGFEVKSTKRNVQVFIQADRLPGGDPSVLLMVPVSAKIDGKSIEVKPNNLRVVAAELFAAMVNQ